MANRYWVGGTASWDNTAGTKWATTSGGTGGAAVPTFNDDVFFDAASGASVVTLSANAAANRLNFTGFTGTFAGTSALTVYAEFRYVTGMTATWTGALSVNFSAGVIFITAGKTLSNVIFAGVSTATLSLVGALTVTNTITVSTGTLNTAGYTVTAAMIASNIAATRGITLGASTVSLTGGGINFTNTAGLTFDAGTSTITCSNASASVIGGDVNSTGVTFYNVTLSNTTPTSRTITANNTFRNLTISGTTSTGLVSLQLNATTLTITNILTLSSNQSAITRQFLISSDIGTTCTISVNSFAAGSTDYDFRDIVITGTASPISGTRFGNAKGNSGITFDVAKTVYWNLAAGGLWTDTAWALSIGGTPAVSNYPLPQDTAIFPVTGLNSGAVVDLPSVSSNIGTVDMSARTTSTMTLATGVNRSSIYGNWINGTGTTMNGTSIMTFTGRTSQTITSAGKTFGQSITIDSPNGTVTLQDAFVSTNTSNSNTAGTILLVDGTFDANNYNVTLSGSVNVSGTNTRTLAIGSGTWTLSSAGTFLWYALSSTNLSVTGTGTISFTSSSTKTFRGGDIQTYPTLRHAGTGTLTITGSNKFNTITNTVLGSILFAGGTSNEFTNFNLNGTSTSARLTIGSTTTTQAILKKPSAWNVGTGSLNSGNNTGLSFTAGNNNFLAISYINGQLSIIPTTENRNFLLFFI